MRSFEIDTTHSRLIEHIYKTSNFNIEFGDITSLWDKKIHIRKKIRTFSLNKKIVSAVIYKNINNLSEKFKREVDKQAFFFATAPYLYNLEKDFGKWIKVFVKGKLAAEIIHLKGIDNENFKLMSNKEFVGIINESRRAISSSKKLSLEEMKNEVLNMN